MSNSDDSFLREVQEEVRRERMKSLFDKYGVLAIGAAVVLLLGVGGYQWYSAYQLDLAQKAGARFAAAQRLLQSDEDKDKETAIKDFQAIAQSGPTNYKVLAHLQLAARFLDDGKTAEAKKEFQAVLGEAEADAELKQYAQLQLITLDADTLDFTTLQNRLTPLTAPSSTFRFSARELLAVKATKEGMKDTARQILAELLGDGTAPPSIRERAEVLMSIVTAPEVKEVAPEPKAETKPEETQAPQPTKSPTTSPEVKPETETKRGPGSQTTTEPVTGPATGKGDATSTGDQTDGAKPATPAAETEQSSGGATTDDTKKPATPATGEGSTN